MQEFSGIWMISSHVSESMNDTIIIQEIHLNMMKKNAVFKHISGIFKVIYMFLLLLLLVLL